MVERSAGVVMPKRVLFHGTTTKFRPQLLKKGLLPRSKTGRSSYEGKLESDPMRVYLTDIYALSFGINSVKKHGGNLMVARVPIEPERLEPDTDFMEGGLHSLKFTDGLECLRNTGCCSVVGPVNPDRLYIFTKKQTVEIAEKASLRIETGVRHHGFRKIHEDQLEYFLVAADTYTFDGECWVNSKTGMSV
jgi:hypothetical protein